MKLAPAFKVITEYGPQVSSTDYRLVLCGDLRLHYLAGELHPKKALELEQRIDTNDGYDMIFECTQLVQKTVPAQATRCTIDYKIGEIKPRFSIFTFQNHDEFLNYLGCHKHIYRPLGLCKMTISLGEFGTDKKELEIDMDNPQKQWELFTYNMDQMGASAVVIPGCWAAKFEKFKKGSFYIMVNWGRLLGLEAPTITQSLLNPSSGTNTVGDTPMITALPRAAPAEVEFRWPLDDTRKAMTVHCLNIIERHVKIDKSRLSVKIAAV